MPHPIPPRPRTVEQKLLDLVLHMRSLNEEALGVNDQGQPTGIAEELNAIEYDFNDMVQMMEGRVFRLRQRVRLYRDSREHSRILDELMTELPRPHA